MNTSRRSKRGQETLGEITPEKENETTPPKNRKKADPETPNKATSENSSRRTRSSGMPPKFFGLDMNTPSKTRIKTQSKSPTKSSQKLALRQETKRPQLQKTRQLDLNLDSEDAMESDGYNDDQENNFPDVYEFKDETDDIRQLNHERYFNKGKTPQMNRGRRGRKKGTIGNKDTEKLSDDENEKEKLAELEALNMAELRGYMKSCELSDAVLPKEIIKENQKQAKWHFPRWRNLLPWGFNILVYGLGSKSRVLEEFRAEFLSNFNTLTVDGFLQDVSMKEILISIDEEMKLKCPAKRGAKQLVEWASQVGKALEMNGTHLILIINNIDGPNLRHPVEIEALDKLASRAPTCLHIIASVDHINAQAIFNPCSLANLRFVFSHFPTLRLPTQEILASESMILGLNSKSSKIQHTLSSLDVIWSSFPENSRKIFRLFFALHFSANAAISFWDLFDEARDRFYVSTDVALRQQIVEFEDHRIVRIRRSEDGTEKLSSAVERDLIEKFLQEKRLTLELDDE